MLSLTLVTAVSLLASQGMPAAAPAGDLPVCLQSIDRDWIKQCPRTLREFARSRSWLPSESAMAELQTVQPTVEALCRSLREPCPWTGDPLSLVLDTKTIDSWATILDADSRRLERFNERVKALDRIVAMIDLAGVVGSVARADFQRETVRLQSAAGRRLEAFLPLFGDAAMAARARDALLACKKAQDQALSACIATERARWIARPTERARAGATGAELLASARLEPSAAIIKSNEYPLARLKGDELIVELRTGDAYFDAVDAAWRAPNGAALISDLQRRADDGDFGAWIAAARPELLVVRSELDRARTPFNALVDLARVQAAGGSSQTPPDSQEKPPPNEDRQRRSPRKVKR
jgi:hypothetical protein